ncbi:MAG: hypothetical protein ACXADL_01410 [Candidatus Thorarchaeota archaeon]|jgi:hypothetical protein
MRKTSLVTLLLVSVMIVGAIQAQPLAVLHDNSDIKKSQPVQAFESTGFDSDNITIVLVTPANLSEVVGTFDMNLTITSVNGPLNLTLFIEDEIYPDYNRTLIGVGSQNVTVDSTLLGEGNLNFTLLFEDNSTGTNDKETYYLVFNVNNHGPPNVELLSPEVDSIFTGLDNLTLNITSDYSEVYLNITVDGDITQEFNATLVPVGVSNFTINGTRYENNDHTIEITVYTEEGLSDSTSVDLSFLDYVRFIIREVTNEDKISGNATLDIVVVTPQDNVTFSVYVDGDLTEDVVNITIPNGRSSFNINTLPYSEGLHNFTFIAYDGIGHRWQYKLRLEVDNHGIPSVEIISPRDAIVVGVVNFTIDIDTTWDTIVLEVYVDNALIESYNATPGMYSFLLDTSNFTKWEHLLKVIVTTTEDLSAEAEETFGFASVKAEEVLSLVILLGIAFAIPIIRWRKGQSIRTVLLVDVIFGAVVIGLFLALGVSSLPFALWHFNLASVWAIGSIFVFTNWVIPLVTGELVED